MIHNKLIDSLKVFLSSTFRSLGYEVRRPREVEQVMGLVHLPIRTIIDVGANVGQFAQFARKKFKNAKIYCFEPIPQAYAKLKEWAEKDGHSVAYPLALGEENKTVEFFVHSDHSPSSSLLRTTPLKHHYYPFTKKQQAITVQMTKLDDWLSKEQIKLEEEILIKLDVQGYEDRVLRGATRLLQKSKAVIAEVNFDKFYEDQATFWDIAILLRECGYDYVGNWSQSIALDGHVTFIDAVFVRK